MFEQKKYSLNMIWLQTQSNQFSHN